MNTFPLHVAGLACLVLAAFAGTAAAAPSFAGDAIISPPLTVQDANVAQAVGALMQRYDVPVRVVGEVKGAVSGRFGDVEVASVLDRLGALHGFYWYFDGSFLEIGPTGDVEMELFRVPPPQIDPFLSDIENAGLSISQFPLNVNRTTGMIFARGPESLRSVLKTIADLHQGGAAQSVTILHGRDVFPVQ